MENFRKVKERLNPDIEFLGVLVTDFDKRTALTNEIVGEVFSHFDGKVFETMIPRSVVIEEAVTQGKSIVDYKTADGF